MTPSFLPLLHLISFISAVGGRSDRSVTPLLKSGTGVTRYRMARSLLHGMLHATIFEADSLKNRGRASGGVRKFLRKLVGDLKTTVGHGESYPQLYATIGLEEPRVGRTRMIPDEPANRRWYETFRIYCAHMAENVIFTIGVDIAVGTSLTGRAYLPVTEILVGEEVDRWL